ncbi:MAG: helix-turn-helix domain-containing protein [Butyrivibrio sp.]|nr:helix-turn-helix domain-containing protein [Butyrivibrio sp.]
MFKENLKTLRKQKGMSQEALAQQLNVVRQTISKWEKGLSVPDGDTLIHIADLFGTSVSELLGSKLEQEDNANEVAAQLALQNERQARAAGIRRKIVEVVITIICIGAIAAIYSRWNESWHEFGQNLYHLFNP